MNSTSRYIPPYRRYSSSSSFRPESRPHFPSYRRSQPFLTLEDLHIRYASNSPPLRLSRTQRSLSAGDLPRRYSSTRYLSTPPFPPRDLEVLRSRDISASPISRIRISLSIKLSDPPVFNRINRYILFDDWKIRIQDKLTHNSDYFLIELFKIIYIITRLGEEATKYTSLR